MEERVRVFFWGPLRDLLFEFSRHRFKMLSTHLKLTQLAHFPDSPQILCYFIPRMWCLFFCLPTTGYWLLVGILSSVWLSLWLACMLHNLLPVPCAP